MKELALKFLKEYGIYQDYVSSFRHLCEIKYWDSLPAKAREAAMVCRPRLSRDDLNAIDGFLGANRIVLTDAEKSELYNEIKMEGGNSVTEQKKAIWEQFSIIL